MKLIHTVLITMMMLGWGNGNANPVQQNPDVIPIPGDLQLVASRLADYTNVFPEVAFYHLRGPADLAKLNQLTKQLGNGASNVDYEHPPKLRKLLLEAQMGRIELMLNYSMPSSTLFKTGENSLFHKPYLCVITLDENIFLTDQLAATRFITGQDKITTRNFPTNTVLDNQTFINFTIDHEVFHCLDAYLNGPTRPKTKSQLTASYHDYRAEIRADSYAALMHRMSSRPDSFLFNLANYRSLNIIYWDITHYTSPAIRQILHLKDSDIEPINTQGVLEYVMHMADMNIMSRDHYGYFVRSAAEVAFTYGDNEAMYSTEVIEAENSGYTALDDIRNSIKKDIMSAEQHISPTIAGY